MIQIPSSIKDSLRKGSRTNDLCELIGHTIQIDPIYELAEKNEKDKLQISVECQIPICGKKFNVWVKVKSCQIPNGNEPVPVPQGQHWIYTNPCEKLAGKDVLDKSDFQNLAPKSLIDIITQKPEISNEGLSNQTISNNALLRQNLKNYQKK